MQILIQKNNKDINSYIDVTSSIVSELTLDERIDQVLDSGTFSFLSRDFTNAIEPFTRCIIKEINSKYGMYDGCLPFFCTSNCNKYLTVEGLYYHEVQLYEPTKLLECLILGTKAFSHVEGKNNYNSNYDRIRIITELMNQKYDYNIELDESVNPFNLSSEREYTFGAGTTMFDAINEIMKTEGCIPRLWFKQNSYYKKFILGYVKINALKTSTIVPISQITKQSSTQSVDEYCSEMEAEYSEVVDRDTLQKCTLSCRSQDTAIYKDTACLITPSKIERLNALSIKCDLTIKGTTMCLIKKNIFNQAWEYCNKNNSFINRDVRQEIVSYSVLLTNDSTNYSDYFMEKLKAIDTECYGNLLSFLIDSCGWDGKVTNDGNWLIVYMDNTYSGLLISGTTLENVYNDYYIAVYNDNRCFKGLRTNNRVLYHLPEINLTSRVLNYEQWNLLEASEKPKYLYWQNGENYIDGFYNTYNDDFWKSIVYGKVNPFIPSFAEAIRTQENKYTGLFDDNDIIHNAAEYYWKLALINQHMLIDENGLKVIYKNVPLYSESVSDLNQTIKDYTTGIYDYLTANSDFTKLIYQVKYYTSSPIYLRSNKSSYSCQITTSRSYNNGANTVDFNMLAPAVQRAVDMQGLPITTIYSKDNIDVGVRLEDGYVISKQSTYKMTDKMIYSSYVYNLSPNYQQIAAAIGVDTQYEATNLPQTGIVTRFIELQPVGTIPSNLDLYLILKVDTNARYISKPIQNLEVDSNKVLICEAFDNYCFDNAVSGEGAYRTNKSVSYTDADNTIERYAYLCLGTLKNTSIEILDELPYLDSSNYLERDKLINKKIYKDSRERLVFVIKE